MVIHINGLSRKLESLLIPFSIWVITGTPKSTKQVHRAPTFVAQSPPPLEMECTVDLYNLLFSFVDALVPTISGTLYEHMFHNIVSVPLLEAELFPVLPRLIFSWFILMRICCVMKHPCLFQILQYFCL